MLLSSTVDMLCSPESKKRVARSFPFHSKNCREMCNMRTGTESVDPIFYLQRENDKPFIFHMVNFSDFEISAPFYQAPPSIKHLKALK